MKKNEIVLIFFGFCLLYFYLTKKESMSNSDIKNMVNEIYKADVESIRNLSNLAKDLTKNGKLIIQGGLEILGPVKISNDLTVGNQITLKSNGELRGIGFTKINNNINNNNINISSNASNIRDNASYIRSNASNISSNTSNKVAWNDKINLKITNGKCYPNTNSTCATYVQSKHGGKNWYGKLAATPDGTDFTKAWYITKDS